MTNKSSTYQVRVFIFLSLFMTSQLVVAQVHKSQAIAGEYIVKMKSHTGSTANNRLNAGFKAVKKMGSAIRVKQAFWGSDMMHVSSNSKSSIDQLKADPDVEFVEPNYMLSVDPVDIQPFGVAAGGSDTYDQSGADVKVTEAWSIEKPNTQGSKVVVAVIDTGLDTSHDLFKESNAIWQNMSEYNGITGVDDDGNGYIDDINGWNYVAGNGNMLDDDDHGTHVSGIILGVGQDILAYPVRESKIKIMPLKFLDAAGSGSTANAVSAIYYAVNMGAKVINNSWGGSNYSKSLHEAYTYAYNHGVFIATAAGNSGTSNDSTPMYPASLDTPGNLAVAASTDADNKASFSNYGSTVGVAAPGVSIVSSVTGSGCVAPGCFQMMSGTSMASPFVAGVAALILREASQLSGYQVKNIITSTSDIKSSLSGKVSSGGRVNVLNAIQSAQSQASTANYLPSYSPSYNVERSVASETSEAPKAAGCGLVKAFIDETQGGGGASAGESQSLESVLLIIGMIVVPVGLAVSLRFQVQAAESEEASYPVQRRKFARYNLVKNLAVQIGDHVIQAATDTISLGGISFSGELSFAQGQVIKFKIADLDQEVEGEVVWCSQQQSYGVRFLNSSEQLRTRLTQWTAGLVPT